MFRPLTRSHAYRDPPRYKRQHELQGTGDIVPVFTAHLDPTAAASAEGTGLFYALLDNHRERVVYPRFPAEGLSMWISGQKVGPRTPMRLLPGLHPILLRVEPPHFTRQPPPSLPPVEVAKGLASGKLQPVWPKHWLVVGPVPAELPPFDTPLLSRLPEEEVAFHGFTVPKHTFVPQEHTLWLANLVDLHPGLPLKPVERAVPVRIGAPQSAYAYAQVDVPADGTLYVNAACHGGMRWHLDGTIVYDTLLFGNPVAPLDLASHAFAVPVSKGKHVLCVQLVPDPRGWTFTALGGFTTAPPESLADLRFQPKFSPPPRDTRIDPALVEIPLPDARQEYWRRRATTARAVLEAIVRELPGTPQAAQAELVLKALQ